MKEIIIHVGHGKTGTSYLQSILAINSDLLNRRGFYYPYHKSTRDAVSGKVSSGNGSLLLDGDVIFDKSKITVYSNELLFFELNNSQVLSNLVSKFKLKVILYSRNVFEHSFSRWAQDVKRGGLINNIDSYLQSNPVGPYQMLLEWIKKSDSLGFELIVRNYSNHKYNLKDRFLTDLFGCKIDASTFREPKFGRVNRSLTLPEYEIQRLFNAIEGNRSSKYISDLLVNRLPNITSDKIKCNDVTYNLLMEKLSPILLEINDFLESDEEILIESKEFVVDDCNNTFKGLDLGQIKVMADGIKERFHLNILLDSYVDTIRDIALKIERNDNLDISDAINLMKVAHTLRPHGPLINKKLSDWGGNDNEKNM